MGEHELREALHRETQAKIRAIWLAAENAVAARRAEVAAEVAGLRAASARRQVAALAAEQRARRSVAATAARQRLLATETLLLERLYRLAVQQLGTFGAMERRRLWPVLAGELPPGEWRRVRVHPEDVAPARQRFPAAEVDGVAELGGGLVVATADGRITVDNSLAGRLSRCWPELQALLLAAIHKEVADDAAGSATAG